MALKRTLLHNRIWGTCTSFVSTCYRKSGGYWHLHIGGFPNWFQIRVAWRGEGRRFMVTREDTR